MTSEPDIGKQLRENAPADHGLASGDLMRDAAAEIERLTERGMEAEAWCNQLNIEIERLRALLVAIERHTAPGTRTWDTCLHDMGLANDLARAALEPKP